MKGKVLSKVDTKVLNLKKRRGELPLQLELQTKYKRNKKHLKTQDHILVDKYT